MFTDLIRSAKKTHVSLLASLALWSHLFPFSKWHRMEFIHPTAQMLAIGQRLILKSGEDVRVVRDQVDHIELVMWLRDL